MERKGGVKQKVASLLLHCIASLYNMLYVKTLFQK